MEAKLKRQATPYKIRLVESPEEVKKLVDVAYDKIKPTISANGFRKGNVPREVAEKQPHFNKYTSYSEVFDILYKKAVEQLGVDVVDASDFEIVGPFEDNIPLTIQATVYLKPTVEKFDINEVSAVKNVTVVSEQMIEDQIKAQQSSKALFENITDANYVIKTGDVLIIDFSGQVDGKAFSGGTAKNFRFVVGETKFISGFEEQMIKFKLNEEGKVITRFPTDYHAKELQDKDAVFTVKINKINSKLPKTLEQLAIDEGKTVDEFRQSIHDKLIADYARIDEENYESDILTQCVLKAKIEPIPTAMIEWELANEWHQLLYRMGTTEEEFLKKNKNGKDVFYGQKRPRVEKSLEVKIFLDHVCKINNFTASKEEVEEFVVGRAKTLNKSEEEIKGVLENLKKDTNYRASETAVKHEKATKWLSDTVRKNVEKT
jgi:trigger factor